MRVFVAGGSGVVGRRLVPQLVARGHQVTATTTNPAKLDLLKSMGADAVVMDGLDAASGGCGDRSLATEGVRDSASRYARPPGDLTDVHGYLSRTAVWPARELSRTDSILPQGAAGVNRPP